MTGILPVMKYQKSPNISALVKKEIDPEITRDVGTLLAGAGGSAREISMGQFVGRIVGTTEVPAGDKLGKLVAWDPAATDGSQVIHGICLKDCEAPSGADLVGGLLSARRFSVLSAGAVKWPATITEAQKTAAIADIEDRLGLILRA